MSEVLKFINPITGKEVDEIIKEKQAKERGYFDFQFMLKYLEDENEFVKYFIYEGKKIIVDMAKPMLEYKKKLNLDYERILQTTTQETHNNLSIVPVTGTCSIDDTSCVSCSG